MKIRNIEQAIVAAMVKYLANNGWKPAYVYDGGENVKTSTAQDVAEVVFSVDESRAVFTNGIENHGVVLICGNGEDLVSDWSYNTEDVDGFNATMDAFLAKLEDMEVEVKV